MWIPAPHGRLEALLREPPGTPAGAALLCHPHPLHGGTMHTKAVFRAAQALVEAGLLCLRFNFRGVGASTGSWGDGVGEAEDARVALDFLTGHAPGLPLLVGGFSFGARIGLSLGVEDSRADALLGMGLPLTLDDFGFLEEVSKPLLIVQGEEDEFGAGSEVTRAAARAGPRATLVRIEGSDHYFTGREDRLQAAIGEWLADGAAADLFHLDEAGTP